MYARWIPNIQCPNEISLTVNFETNGGSKVDKVVLTSRNITNFKLNIPTPTKENYNFNGWYYDIDLKNKVDLSMIFNPDLSKFECKDFEITLYARWVHKKTVTLNGASDNDVNMFSSSYVKHDFNRMNASKKLMILRSVIIVEVISLSSSLGYPRENFIP